MPKERISVLGVAVAWRVCHGMYLGACKQAENLTEAASGISEEKRNSTPHYTHTFPVYQ